MNCPTVDEVDEFWAQLSIGGETRMTLDTYPFSDRYGWTEDEYGVSWQIVPTVLSEHLQNEGTTRAGRVMKAMLQMRKIDIRTLEEAYDG